MQECPPYFYLYQVANHCPKAVSTYLDLWNRRDKENYVAISIKEVRNHFVSLARFRHDLKLLLKEGLLSFEEKNEKFKIEITGWDDENWNSDLVC